MSANSISPIIAPGSRRPLTGNATVRPDSCLALLVSPPAAPKYPDRASQSKPVPRSMHHDHMILVPRRLLTTRRAATKSP